MSNMLSASEVLVEYRKHRQMSDRNFRMNSPVVMCECGYITKLYRILSHQKTARHREQLQLKQQIATMSVPPPIVKSAALSDNSRADSSDSEGGREEEEKI
jgi:hypothetical protein